MTTTLIALMSKCNLFFSNFTCGSEVEFDASDIDQYSDYSDDETQIEIKECDLMDYLSKLEQTNLFKMNLNQEQMVVLEKMERASKAAIEEKKAVKADMDQNLKLLLQQKVEK